MKAIGEVKAVDGPLRGVIGPFEVSRRHDCGPVRGPGAPDRLVEAGPPPKPKSLPDDLRRARLPNLPANISLASGRI